MYTLPRFLVVALSACAMTASTALTQGNAHKVIVYDPLLTSVVETTPDQDQVAAPFDFYVLAQSWQPEFCKGQENVYPGCKVPMDFWRTHFTVHGLWPELTKGKHPGFCKGAAFDADAIEKAIGLKVLMEYWPDVKYSQSSPEYPDFWKHEWTRHGTCSGLSQVEYFSHAVNLIRNGTATTPTIIQQNVGKTISVDKLRAAYTMTDAANADCTAALKCLHGDTLSQVFTCWEKDSYNMPTVRRPCPSHILNEDTCTESSIFIPAFP